jgi:uncharacterized protein (TIGR02453 family)
MKAAVVDKSTLGFLGSLARNNNRDWFMSHRDQYEAALQNVSTVIDALIMNMNQHDQIETPSGKKALYRIYNDVRFSKDKTPYSPRFAGYLKRVKPQLRGGYYFWIKPGASRAGCGFAYPNPEDLRRIREDISLNYDDWLKLLKKKSIVNTFGSMQGEQLRTAPKGYERDHPAIDLLRYKQFWFERSFSDQEVLSPQFVKELHKTFRAIRPFFDYMTDVLTTDGNGESRI